MYTTNLIHTPENGIPIAEAFYKDVHIVLRFKKHGSKVYEELSLEGFLHLIYKTAEST